MAKAKGEHLLADEYRMQSSRRIRAQATNTEWGKQIALTAGEAKQERRRRDLARRKTPARRASEEVALAARDVQNTQKLIQVFLDAIDPRQPITVRLKGAEAWLSIERDEFLLHLKQEDSKSKVRSRDELIAALTERLSQGPAAEVIRTHLESAPEEVVDVEVVEDDSSAQS